MLSKKGKSRKTETMSSCQATVRVLLLATVFFGCTINLTLSFYFNFPIFSNNNETEVILTNHARMFLNAIQITPDIRGAPIDYECGRAVYRRQFKLRNNGKTASFSTNFVLDMSPQTSPGGGEGMAFILTADAYPPYGSNGQWLGTVGPDTNGKSEANIVAIEFDTRKNFPEDIDSNHVGLNVNSIISIVQQPLSSFSVNLTSARDVYGIIKYDGANISIYVSMSNKTEDQLKNLVISRSLDLSILPDEVYVGFSASTSNYTQLNTLKSWQFYGTDFGRPRKWVWFTVPGVLTFCGAVLAFIFWERRRRLNRLEEAYGSGIEDQLQDFSIAPRAQKFRLRELKKATDNFDPKNRLGQGGFGTVYRGILMNKEVAVKRISKDSRQGKQEFIAEVATIGSLHHKNLVKLTGWCYEKRDLLLVYEYMPNGSLDKLIFGYSKIDGNGMLSAPNWATRRNIIYGVAEALDYLHNGCEKTILHRDIKSSNVMLDSKFEAKLGDFGLARTICRTEQTHHSTREIAGTPGYMAPETFLTSRATRETDVYAFGVLILEVICRRRPGNPSELGGYDGSLAHWAWEFHREGKIVEAVDERIEGQFVKEEMEYLLILGLACCQPNPIQRPTMKNVLQVLKGEANPPILPSERPSFVWPPIPPSFKEDANNLSKESQLTLFTELTGR